MILNGGQSLDKPIVMELPLSQFYNLLHELEKTKNIMK